MTSFARKAKMRLKIAGIIKAALMDAIEGGRISLDKGLIPPVIVEKPKKEEFGDFSTNIAMLLARSLNMKPVDAAGIISECIASLSLIRKCEVKGPGFINIFLDDSYWFSTLLEIVNKRDYGTCDAGAGKKIIVEFVSANPTGPLHIGHGRGAAVGDALSNILKAAGYCVTREYYINDRGRQMQALGESVELRCRELQGEKVELGKDHYKGAYIKEIAEEYLSDKGRDRPFRVLHGYLREDIEEFAREAMLKRIKKDLSDFGITFDVWRSECDIFGSGAVNEALLLLKEKGVVYENEGALWFKTTGFGDDKDRVLVKADGELTYFATDIAYHREKAERGFDQIVNVWGADHHGYEARVRAGLKALGFDDERLRIIFIQLVSLLRAGAPVAMGKREGEFVTLRQVMDEVGKDACRFFFLSRKSDAHLEFDLELAKKQAPENPVYYVQYCHARLFSIMEFAAERGVMAPRDLNPEILKKLGKDEIELIRHLSMFEECVEKSALSMEPHRITFYLTELAGLFHSYYNKTRVVSEDLLLTQARLILCGAVATVVENGLGLLGISAPDKM